MSLKKGITPSSLTSTLQKFSNVRQHQRLYAYYFGCQTCKQCSAVLEHSSIGGSLILICAMACRWSESGCRLAMHAYASMWTPRT